MSNKNKLGSGRVKQSEHVYAVRIKTEGNSLGRFKTSVVLSMIALQLILLVVSYLYFWRVFQWYAGLSIIISLITCLHVLSSEYHGQAKATWVLFLLVCFGFGYIIYLMSDKHVLFVKAKRKYNQIFKQAESLQTQIDMTKVENQDTRSNCNYLYNAGKFVANDKSKTTYYSSGAQLFDAVLDQLEKAKKFIFIEYYIISNGILLERFLSILKEKVQNGVDVRIIYDDMGSHGTLKRKTKKEIIRSGIKLQSFNRLVPIFNIALNLRDHRKIVVVDGNVSFTGGANLADEYTNEKRMHGYWKDEGIKIEGRATDNLTISFLQQWKFLTGENIDFSQFINRAENFESDGVVVPFVSGPNYPFSVTQNMYANQISNATEKLYIMTPYFIPDETITNLLINKARAGVDVRIILPDVADKKFVYYVSRNNAEKLLDHGVRLYTMTHSFVHSKVVLNESSVIVGSINMDLRSFNQQFESGVFTNEQQTLKDVNLDFMNTFDHSEEVTIKTRKRNKLSYRIIAGLFNLVSPFM